MNKIKLFFVFVLVAKLISFNTSVHAENTSKVIKVAFRDISIVVNGKALKLDHEPFIYKDRVFVSLRTISDVFNKKITWEDQNNMVFIADPQDNIIRLKSYFELLNYVPDNYKVIKTETKLTQDEIQTIYSLLTSSDVPYLLDLIKNPERSYKLTNDKESIIVFQTNAGIGIRYEDSTFYFLTRMVNSFHPICGSNKGWESNKMSISTNNKTDEDILYLDYITKVNYSILKDYQNYSKQITELYSISLWIASFDRFF